MRGGELDQERVQALGQLQPTLVVLLEHAQYAGEVADALLEGLDALDAEIMSVDATGPDDTVAEQIYAYLLDEADANEEEFGTTQNWEQAPEPEENDDSSSSRSSNQRNSKPEEDEASSAEAYQRLVCSLHVRPHPQSDVGRTLLQLPSCAPHPCAVCLPR